MSEHFNAPLSEYEAGFDRGFKEEATILLMDEIEDYYLDGYKKATIMHWLTDERGFKGLDANTFCSKVWKRMIESAKKREEGLKEKNLMRLERLYTLSIDSGDWANANKAIDTMNKLGQLYKEKIEVEQVSTTFVLGGETEEDNS